MKRTKNLSLNITDMKKDGLSFFNFDTDLGHNFEVIDANVVTHRNATNCILDIPKNINLELADGRLTIKKGSKTYIPDGFKNDGKTLKFLEVIVDEDVYSDDSVAATASSRIITYGEAAWGETKLNYFLTNIYSSSVQPTKTEERALWYDTTNNLMKTTSDFGTTWTVSQVSLPIAMVSNTLGVGFTSIDQVFNGFGYIGSTFYALPGVKCLMPNGRNLDGSLKNIVHTLNEVNLYTIKDSFVEENAPVVLLPSHIGYFREYTTIYSDKRPSEPAHHTRWYDTVNNYWHEYSNENGWQLGNYCIIGAMDVNNTKINSFTFKNTLQVVDFYDYQNKISELEEKIQALQTALEALQG